MAIVNAGAKWDHRFATTFFGDGGGREGMHRPLPAAGGGNVMIPFVDRFPFQPASPVRRATFKQYKKVATYIFQPAPSVRRATRRGG